jgi:hypothetical protein
LLQAARFSASRRPGCVTSWTGNGFSRPARLAMYSRSVRGAGGAATAQAGFASTGAQVSSRPGGPASGSYELEKRLVGRVGKVAAG